MGIFRKEAEEKAKEILKKAKTEVDEETLVDRLRKSMIKSYMRHGEKLMQKDKRYLAYKFVGRNYGIGIGIRCPKEDCEKSNAFDYAVSFCTPDDYEEWNDKTAVALIGMRFLADDFDHISFPKRVSPEVAARAVLGMVTGSAYAGHAWTPHFLRKAVLNECITLRAFPIVVPGKAHKKVRRSQSLNCHKCNCVARKRVYLSFD